MPVAPEWSPERHAEERAKHTKRMAASKKENAEKHESAQRRQQATIESITKELGLEGQEIVFMCQRGGNG